MLSESSERFIVIYVIIESVIPGNAVTLYIERFFFKALSRPCINCHFVVSFAVCPFRFSCLRTQFNVIRIYSIEYGHIRLLLCIQLVFFVFTHIVLTLLSVHVSIDRKTITD